MVERTAEAEWRGDLRDGRGVMKLGSGAFEGSYSFGTRFGDEKGTNPEELIGAAHAGCFSMAFALMVGQAGFTPKRIHTTAKVAIERAGDGFQITRIHLDTEAAIPGVSREKFSELAEAAKRDCPVSRALAGPRITLDARLVES
ncbi:MAG TPA: OsmC family protein [Rhodanobacteraceae bacterium]|nr:OsmC family protein [Rhodanobacteraceae bacterium]